MRPSPLPRWPVGAVAAGLVALFAAGAVAQPPNMPGRRLGPDANAPAGPDGGGSEFTCGKCGNTTTGTSAPVKCPKCGVTFDKITNTDTGQITTTSYGSRRADRRLIALGVCVAVLVIGGVIRLINAASSGGSSGSSPTRRKRRPRPEPDEDDRPARRPDRARSRDVDPPDDAGDYEVVDDAPPVRPKARTAAVGDEPPRRAKPVKPAGTDQFEVVDAAPQFEVVDDTAPPKPRRT